MPIEPRLNVPASAIRVDACAPLNLQVITGKRTKTFELTVSDMQKALKAEPGFVRGWIDKIWDAIRDYFCGTRRTEAKALFGAMVCAKDEATVVVKYFALRDMAPPTTQNTRFSEVFDATTGTVTLGIEVQLDANPRVTLRVQATALPLHEAKRLGLPRDVIMAARQSDVVLADMSDVVPAEVPVVVPAEVPVVVPAEVPDVVPAEVPDVVPAEVPAVVPAEMSDGLTSWATQTCHFTAQGLEHTEALIREGKGTLIVAEPNTVSVAVDDLAEQRFRYWRSKLKFESPAAGQCIYEVDLGVRRPVRSENVGDTRIDIDANRDITRHFHDARCAQKITFHQASAVAFLMHADNAAQELMDLAAIRTPSFKRNINGWACRHHFSIMRSGPDIVVSITSESKLSDEQLRLSATGAQPDAPPQAVTFRQQWVVDPTGKMRCLLATAEPKPAERTANGLAAPDVEGSFLAAPGVGSSVPALPNIYVGSLSAPGDESSFLSASDIEALDELSQRSPDPHIAAFNKWYAALTPSARELLANCTNLRGFLPRVLAILSGDNPLLTEQVARYLTGKVRDLPAGLAEPAPEIPVAVQGALSGLLDHAPHEQTIALLHRLNLELWVDSLAPQYQHGFAQENPDEPVTPPWDDVVSNSRTQPAHESIFLTPKVLEEIFGPQVDSVKQHGPLVTFPESGITTWFQKIIARVMR
ncbi:hypothetical protein [Pandoraea sputorum]|uniref:Uncharacterized protein n=1 Tax=Pandoraea sputorum TaxID=93222 RepID=A0A5E5BKK1_9BURK|nr:hypothetical protein [Pandoraea sputorum]VVE85888.1 hypothetical protein PSP31121_05521 [Pandoraea sputorum]